VFRYRAFALGQVPVHWVVHYDPRGEHSLRYRCKNVNLVEKTVKGVEDELEFLFVPCVLLLLLVWLRDNIRTDAPPPPPLSSCRYSVFTLLSIHVPAKIVGDNPVVIHIQAAIDNANEDDDLPLAPWH
jgi:hypothetical protein